MFEIRERKNLDLLVIVLGLLLLAVSSQSFAQRSERFETPFGEEIIYSANETELCLQMEQRMKVSPMAENHSILVGSSFVRDVCVANPLLEKRVELCSSDYPFYTESCNRNFFSFLLAAKQCELWIRFGSVSRADCTEKLGASYVRGMFEKEFRAHTAYVMSQSLMDQMERLMDERSQSFKDGYDLASAQTKTVLDKWNSTEADFMQKWEEVTEQAKRYYEVAVALQKENTKLRERFREVVNEYETEMRKGQKSLELLASQLATVQARQLAAEAEKQRQRRFDSGLALMALGSSIASGAIGSLPRYTAPRVNKPVSTFKNCNYLVRGASISLPVSWTSPCPKNFSWGGSPAIYAGEGG